MRYETPAALEMAVREAAKASPLDTGRAISGFYFHRLLCRVFANGNASFVLKGGQGDLRHRPAVGRLEPRGRPVGTEGACRGRPGRLRHVRVCRGRAPPRPRTSIAVG